MMPAAKHLDPVLGVDIHIHIVPPGVPVPLPNPFIGIVMDLMDYLPPGIPIVGGASVFVNNMPRAQAGTEAKNIPHLPLWGPIVPLAGNEGEMFMGSATVNVDGEPFTFMACPVLSCQAVGMIAPFRPKKPRKTYSFQLPFSIVLPIPLGPPVLIGGPPTISLTELAMKGVMKGLGKAFKGLRKLQKGSGKIGKFSKKVSKKVHKKAGKAMDAIGVPKKSKARNKIHRSICSLTGHPVDIVTGKVLTEEIDFEGFGVMPFIFERVWYSTSEYDGPLGHGWHHRYDLGLFHDEEESIVAIRMADGRSVIFEAPEEGQGEVFNRGEKAHLRLDNGLFVMRMEGLEYFFDPAAKRLETQLLFKIVDRNGYEIQFVHEEGFLTRVKDGSGRFYRIEGDEDQRIKKIWGTHPERRGEEFLITSFSYSEQGDLVVVKDAHDVPLVYEYNDHLLVREQRKSGLNFYFEYDGNDSDAWCVRTWGDNNLYARELVYDKVNCLTQVKDSLGTTTTHYWNFDGVVTRVIDPMGGVTQMDVNEYSEILKETDPLGRVTQFDYDELGQLISHESADGAKTDFLYEGEDVIQVTDPDGGEWHMEYDQQGRLLTQRNPLEEKTSYHYDEKKLRGTKAPNGAEVSLLYDKWDNPVSLTLPNGSKSSWEYDLLGRCIEAVSPTGAVQGLKFDLMNRVTKVREPDGNVRLPEYDAEGNVTRVKDEHYDVVFEYSGMGRLISRTQDDKTVEFVYDTEEQLTEIRNEAQSIYQFHLDPLGNLMTEIGFDGLRRDYKRDLAGQITEIKRPQGLKTHYEYDKAGRVKMAHYGADAYEMLKYSPSGQILEAKNQHVSVAFERDVLGRIIKETQNGMTVESTYDESGLRSHVSSSLGADLNIERDIMGDASQVEVKNGLGQWKANFERDALGLELVRELPGGAQCVWKRDKLGRPIEQKIRGVSQVLRERTYHWGMNDRLEKVSDSRHGSVSFQYDKRGALIASHLPSGEIEWRMPDAIGNLFKTEDASDRVYGASGQLLRDKGPDGWTSYDYDTEGNLKKKTEATGRVWLYEWNAAGFLRKVVRPDKKEVTFTYDAFGRRATKSFEGEETCWLWDGNVMLHEWVENVSEVERDKVIQLPKPSGAKSAAQKRLQEQLLATCPAHGPPGVEKENIITWVYEPESFVPMAKLVGEESYSILTDQVGAPIELLNQRGESVWSSARIDGYGRMQELEGTRDACPFRWQGQYVDVETNLSYNRYRYLDSESGQYISQDPIGLAGGNPTLYGYVSDSNSWIDVLGLSSTVLNGALGGVTGDKMQAHHLIPEKTWSDNKSFLNEIGIGDQRDAASNGLLMYDTEAGAVKNNKAYYHRGRHDKYSNMVDNRIKNVEYDYLMYGDKAKAKADVEDLQNRLRKALDRNSNSGKAKRVGCK